MNKELIREILKYVDIEGLLSEVLIERIIYKAVDELVLRTDNPLDNMVADIIKPQLKGFILEYIAEEKKKLLAD